MTTIRRFLCPRLTAACGVLSLFFAALTGHGAQQAVLRGHVPDVVAGLQPLGRLPAETNLSLAIGLPLRNTAALTNLLEAISDPSNPNYRHYLTTAQFTEQFGPTEEDYQKVIAFAERQGLHVKRTHINRMIVDVSGPVSTIETAFQVHIQRYQHPTENREFYAPDAEPTIDADLSILHIAGMDNYIIPHPMNVIRPAANTTNSPAPTPFGTTGSGPGGFYTGKDFRPCYVPGVTNTGVGQYIALIEFGQYYTNDIHDYLTNAGIPSNIAISNILIDVSSPYPTTAGYDDGEEALDIDMSMAIAPGAFILVYEGGPSDDLMNQIANDNLASQISLAWGFGIDATTIQIFQQYLLQGQTFDQASGDGGADASGGTGLTGMPYATICGGTSLTTTGPHGAWVSESSWIGSGGGISGYGIPPWQQGISMTANAGSTIYRNFPDIAMLADTVIFWYLKDGQSGSVGGTSASTPEWTAVIALANQQAAAQGQPRIGFANPALYQIGRGQGALPYAKCFHDVTTGDNFSGPEPTLYNARAGYDLCTGWGSPIGSNLITALLAVGTNDFSLNASQVGFTFVPGASGSSVFTVSPMNGYSSDAADFTISNVSPGITSSFGTTGATGTNVLSVAAASDILPGIYGAVVTATSGTLSHSLTLKFVVTNAIPGATRVSLSSSFNQIGIYRDGSTFAGGLDGDGSAFSANLLGPAPSVANVLFTLGPPNANDVISAGGQTVTLPAGQYATLQFSACAVNGNQTSASFRVNYTDGTATTISQNISDWFTPQGYGNEQTLASTAYRDNSDGTTDDSTFNLYAYTLALNQTKTVKSITLPSNGNIKIFAITLVNSPASASVASLYNRIGIYSDGTTFSNTPTGGLDAGGNAYSGNLLGTQQIWNGIPFAIGAANKSNVVVCAGQTITLPAGNYYALRMLATSYDGAELNQSFKVTYADASTQTFTQSLSDWFTPGNYAGESKAVPMGYRDESNGDKDNRTFYLYGYNFSLRSTNITQSFTLPTVAHGIIVSVTLVPNYAPTFTVNPFAEGDATPGQVYSANIATNATDLNAGDTRTFAKVSGPDWLVVAANGALSGTPGPFDAGTNTFVVSVTDAGGLTTSATLDIYVSPAPYIASGLAVSSPGNLTLSWAGGSGPYHIEMSTNLAAGSWVDISGPIVTNSFVIIPTNGAAFYQIVGQ